MPTKLHFNTIDLVGQVFGYLRVIGPAEKRTFGGNIVWECLCSCGKTVTRESKELRRQARGKYGSKIKSCGCSWRGKRSPMFKGIGTLSAAKWANLILGAHRRGILFSISMKHAWSLFEKQNGICALSGLPIKISTDWHRGMTTASLDRMDSSRGYETGNVQWVHVTLNLMKQTLPVEEFINWCRAVATHNAANDRADTDPNAIVGHYFNASLLHGTRSDNDDRRSHRWVNNARSDEAR